MATKKNNGLRIGPISLLTLISVLLLAVLAMLCFTTSNAARAMSARQASAATNSYLLESCAQELLASMDEIAHDGATDAQSAVSAISSQLNELKENAIDSDSAEELSINAKATDTSVAFSVNTQGGQRIDACVTYHDDLTYSIDQWKITTTQDDEDTETLWSGSTTTDTTNKE